MKIIILTLLLSAAIFNRESLPPPPELLPECVGDYVFVYEIPNCSYCNEQRNPYGDYYLFYCPIVRDSGVETIKFVSKCVYASPIDISDINLFTNFLPMASNQNTIMSYIP